MHFPYSTTTQYSTMKTLGLEVKFTTKKRNLDQKQSSNRKSKTLTDPSVMGFCWMEQQLSEALRRWIFNLIHQFVHLRYVRGYSEVSAQLDYPFFIHCIKETDTQMLEHYITFQHGKDMLRYWPEQTNSIWYNMGRCFCLSCLFSLWHFLLC